MTRLQARFGRPLSSVVVVLSLAQLAAGQAGSGTQSHAPVRHAGELSAAPTSLDFGAVASGGSAEEIVTLANTGVVPLRILSLQFLLGVSGNSASYEVDLAGSTYAGGDSDVTHAVDVRLGGGAQTQATVRFSPTSEMFDSITVRLEGNFGQLDLPVIGLGGHLGDPFLHVVIDAPDYVVDYDGDGSESVILDGTVSHTHEPGRTLIDYVWSEDGTPFDSVPLTMRTLGLGAHTIELEIGDDGTPQRRLADDRDVDVVPSNAVPGVLARIYDAGAGGPAALLDAVPGQPDYAELRSDFSVPSEVTVAGSSFTGNVMVRLRGSTTLAAAGTYAFTISGGSDRRLELDGSPVTGSVGLGPGTHTLEARFAVDSIFDLPLDVLVSVDGGPVQPLDETPFTHDQSTLAPVINSMPSIGTVFGGNDISIDGIAFVPGPSVVVHWGATDLVPADFTEQTAEKIRFTSPPGNGPITVTVETPQGTSLPRTFLYDPDGPVPIRFQQVATVPVDSPTAGVWGPDGRFYVTTRWGQLNAIELDQDWNVVSTQTFDGVASLPNFHVHGIAVNPYDPPSPVRIWVAHSKHYVNGGGVVTQHSPYTGEISVLEGPSFDAPTSMVRGLPTSNFDHGMNGMVFDNNGDLLMLAGGITNAGVPHPLTGDIPESPLSASVLKAEVSKAAGPDGFDGDVVYLETAGGAPNDDQRDGDLVDVAPDVDVFAHGPGLRNPYDLVYTTRGLCYATDNGPNLGVGSGSLGPDTQFSGVADIDELLLVRRGNYYGHPNRSRARTDPRQYVYRGTQGPAIPEQFTQALVSLESSVDGIVEYRAQTFGGRMRGDLVLQRFLGDMLRVELSDDGRRVEAVSSLDPFTGALGLSTGPGGALLAMNPGRDQVLVIAPDDLAASGLTVHDITPWRGPASGGTPFTIGGVGFGDLTNTTVTIGGLPATLTEVTSKRIRGVTPAQPAPTTALADVSVTVGGSTEVLDAAYRFLFGPGLEPGTWERLPDAPVDLTDAAATVANGVLYAFGAGVAETCAYDFRLGQWLPPLTPRPFPGAAHGVQVLDGCVYLVGGLGAGSEGRLQIYDPSTDGWSLGADLPWSGGAVACIEVDGLLAAAGGLVGTAATVESAVYDPDANAWTLLPSMPHARHHASGGSDGERFFVFGGRAGGPQVTNGTDDVQVFDPVSGVWDSSTSPGSSLQPLLEGRAAMGPALYYRSSFHLFGGQTLSDPDAVPGSGAYDRVDVYDPESNQWRSEAPLLAPRFGAAIVRFESDVFVLGGDALGAPAPSRRFELFSRQ